MGPDRRPGNRQGSRGPRQPGMRPGLAAPARQVFANLGRARRCGRRPRARRQDRDLCRRSPARVPAGHRHSPGRSVRGPQTGSYRGGRGDAGPARVPDRCPRDRCHRQVAPAHNPLPVRKINSARNPAVLHGRSGSVPVERCARRSGCSVALPGGRSRRNVTGSRVQVHRARPPAHAAAGPLRRQPSSSGEDFRQPQGRHSAAR
jgi:hypothetical protein